MFNVPFYYVYCIVKYYHTSSNILVILIKFVGILRNKKPRGSSSLKANRRANNSNPTSRTELSKGDSTKPSFPSLHVRVRQAEEIYFSNCQRWLNAFVRRYSARRGHCVFVIRRVCQRPFADNACNERADERTSIFRFSDRLASCTFVRKKCLIDLRWRERFLRGDTDSSRGETVIELVYPF